MAIDPFAQFFKSSLGTNVLLSLSQPLLNDRSS